jgi:hypothetical protein
MVLSRSGIVMNPSKAQDFLWAAHFLNRTEYLKQFIVNQNMHNPQQCNKSIINTEIYNVYVSVLCLYLRITVIHSRDLKSGPLITYADMTAHSVHCTDCLTPVKIVVSTE